MKRLDFLDSLRASAALMVVVAHLPFLPNPPLPIPGWSQSFVRYGGAGVTLFFVISAYSLCLTMPGHARTGAPLVSFFVNRLLRIAPLFYLLVAYSVIARYSINVPLPSTWLLLLNVTFLFNAVPAAADSLVFSGWTLGVEMLFYAVFPMLYRLVTGVPRKLVAVLLSLAAYPVFVGLLDTLDLPAELVARYSQLTICLYVPAFAAGMLVFELVPIVPRTAGSVLIALAALIYTLLVAGRLNGVLAQAQLQAVCFGVLLLGMAVRRQPASLGQVTGFLSRISYSVYLLHGPLILAANPLLQGIYRLPLPTTLRFLVAAVAAMAIILPASWLSYRLVEQPCIRLGKMLVARSVGTSPIGVPAA